jgi:hypothetical protein
VEEEAMTTPLHGDPLANTHFRGELSDGQLFVFCPVGNIVSWSQGDHAHKWCHWCKKFFMEIEQEKKR